MRDRRVEPRVWCADLVDVYWQDEAGRTSKACANLEDISSSGACLQMDAPVPFNKVLRVVHPSAELEGRVCYCVYRDTGYFIGLRFEPGFRWDRRHFRPKHLLDPRDLLRGKYPRVPRPGSH